MNASTMATALPTMTPGEDGEKALGSVPDEVRLLQYRGVFETVKWTDEQRFSVTQTSVAAHIAAGVGLRCSPSKLHS